MRKILLLVTVLLLSGCGKNDGAELYWETPCETQIEYVEVEIIKEIYIEKEKLPICDYKYVFRTEVVEINDDVYIVEKYNYKVNGIYKLTTDIELQLGDIIYAAVYEDDSALLYSEIDCN